MVATRPSELLASSSSGLRLHDGIPAGERTTGLCRRGSVTGPALASWGGSEGRRRGPQTEPRIAGGGRNDDRDLRTLIGETHCTVSSEKQDKGNWSAHLSLGKNREK